MSRPAKPALERLMGLTVKGESCWIYQGSTKGNGYGSFKAPTVGATSAHRAAYLLMVGPIAPGLTVDHLCRVKLCVNPAHMELVTLAENGRRAMCLSGDRCRRGHAFTPENTVPRGHRRWCKTCRRMTPAERAAFDQFSLQKQRAA